MWRQTTCIRKDFYLLFRLITTAVVLRIVVQWREKKRRCINSFWFDKFFHSHFGMCAVVLWSLEHDTNMITYEKLSTNQSNVKRTGVRERKKKTCVTREKTKFPTDIWWRSLTKYSLFFFTLSWVCVSLCVCVSIMMTGITALRNWSNELWPLWNAVTKYLQWIRMTHRQFNSHLPLGFSLKWWWW